MHKRAWVGTSSHEDERKVLAEAWNTTTHSFRYECGFPVCAEQASNLRPPVCDTGALPLSYQREFVVRPGALGRDRTCGLLVPDQTLYH